MYCLTVRLRKCFYLHVSYEPLPLGPRLLAHRVCSWEPSMGPGTKSLIPAGSRLYKSMRKFTLVQAIYFGFQCHNLDLSYRTSFPTKWIERTFRLRIISTITVEPCPTSTLQGVPRTRQPPFQITSECNLEDRAWIELSLRYRLNTTRYCMSTSGSTPCYSSETSILPTSRNF